MKKRVLLLVLAVLALTFVLVSCGHEHDFKQSEVITEATCDVVGKAKFVCECGESEEREIAVKGHTFGEEQTKAPTCWDDGYTYKVCSVCNAESEHTNVVKAGPDYHKFDEIKEVLPDCSKVEGGDGYRETVCSICHIPDPNGKRENIKANHDWVETKIEATCQAPGSITMVCKNCSAPGQVTILDQLAHDNESLGTSEATCDEAGYESFKCKVCGEESKVEIAEALGHNLKTEKEWCEPTCLLDGYDYFGCTRCDYKERIPGINGTAHGHDIETSYDDESFREYLAPTCITDGYIIPKCRRCNELINDEIRIEAATGVHFVSEEAQAPVSATCHEPAYIQYNCTVDDNCTETRKVYDGEKLSHNLVFIKTTTPRCDKPGYDLYVCANCPTDKTENSKCDLGCVVHKNEVVIDHKPTVNKTTDAKGNPIDFVPATCIKNAYTIWECGDCSKEWTQTYSEEEKPLMKHGIDINGEDCWSVTDRVTLPTCESEGYTIYYCPNDKECKEEIKRDYTRRTEHPFTSYIDGRLVCSACNVTYRDISTYLDQAIKEGQLEIDKDTMLDWELRGYEEPELPTALVAGTATVVYDKTKDNVDISGGIIALRSTGEATYTIVIEYENGDPVTKTVKSANAYYDLYENVSDEEGQYFEQNGVGGKIVKVTITANNADATVSVYAYEG